jgi:outer membrane protein assembly factor BamB
VNIAKFWVASALAIAAGLPVWANDWPQWRGPARNGISSEPISRHWAAEGPKVRWAAWVGTGFSGVAVAQGRAYTLGNTNTEDTVWCFDARAGDVLWKQRYTAQLSPQWYEGGPGATPTVVGDHVFTISKWGDVFCFDAKTGSIAWQRDLRQQGIKPNRWGFAGSPLVWRDRVIFNAGSAGTALDRATGRVVWSNGTNTTGYASPVLFPSGQEELVLIFGADHLVALDPQTGAERWRYPWKTDWDTNNSDPIVDDDRIFLSSFSRGCSLLSLRHGVPEPVYDSKAICNNLSPGVLLGSFYYVFSGEAKKETQLRCFDLSSGQVKWATPEPAFGSLLVANGTLVVLTEKGELLLYGNTRQAGGAKLIRAEPIRPEPICHAKILNGTCWTPPSLANGLLYVRSAKGEVRCLDVTEP